MIHGRLEDVLFWATWLVSLLYYFRNGERESTKKILTLLWMNYLLGIRGAPIFAWHKGERLKGQSGYSEFYMVSSINAIKFVSCTIDYILWLYHH